MAFDYTADFAQFWASEFDSLPCPPIPQKPEDLSLTARMALSAWNDGKLHQNLFGNSSLGSQPLPADVETRRRNNQLLPQDAPALRAANLEHLAVQVEQLGQRQQDQRLADEAIKGRKAYLEEKKRAEAWSNASYSERLVMAPPTPEAVASARESWGITGKPEWQK